MVEENECLAINSSLVDERGVGAVLDLQGSVLEHLGQVDVPRPRYGNAVWVSFGAHDLAGGGDGLKLDVDLAVLDRVVRLDVPVLADVGIEGALPVAYGKVGGTRVSQTHVRLRSRMNTWYKFSRAPLEDAVLVVADEVEARPGRLVAARQGDLPPVEGIGPLVVRGCARQF